ncbi:MAG: hypothetical protein ACRD0G_00525 [Acidimicrobiales bacterium]
MRLLRPVRQTGGVVSEPEPVELMRECSTGVNKLLSDMAEQARRVEEY